MIKKAQAQVWLSCSLCKRTARTRYEYGWRYQEILFACAFHEESAKALADKVISIEWLREQHEQGHGNGRNQIHG